MGVQTLSFQTEKFSYYKPLFSKQTIADRQQLLYEQNKSLHTGYRFIPKPGERSTVDINEKMRYQVKSLTQLVRTGQNGYTQLQLAEGGLSNVRTELMTMRAIIVEAQDSDLTDDERSLLNTRLAELPAKVTKAADDAVYGTRDLLDGTFQATFHTGASSQQKIQVKIRDVRAAALQVHNLDLSTQSGANTAFVKIEAALKNVDAAAGATKRSRQQLGTLLNLQSSVLENLNASGSTIRAFDRAKHELIALKDQIMSPQKFNDRTNTYHKSNAQAVLSLLVRAIGASE